MEARQGSCYVKDLKKEYQTDNAYGYQPPKVSLEVAMMADLHDPVVQKQKEEFLQNINSKAKASMRLSVEPFVQFEKIEIICPGRPEGDINIDLTSSTESVKELVA